jgi:hypothetical protein
MDGEPKKLQANEEAVWMEIEEAEREEMDDRMELEEEETNSSREEDDDDEEDEIDREEAIYDRLMTEIKEWDLAQRVEERQAKEKKLESESEEDTDEDEEEDSDEDEDEIGKIFKAREKGCGRS